MNKQIILSTILSAILVTSLIVIVSPTLVLAKKARSAEYHTIQSREVCKGMPVEY